MLYALIFIGSVLDYFFTFYWLAHCERELNPLMVMLMSQPFWISFVVKNGWTALMLALLYFLKHKNSRAVCVGLKVLIAAYGLIICDHLYGLTLEVMF